MLFLPLTLLWSSLPPFPCESTLFLYLVRQLKSNNKTRKKYRIRQNNKKKWVKERPHETQTHKETHKFVHMGIP